MLLRLLNDPYSLLYLCDTEIGILWRNTHRHGMNYGILVTHGLDRHFARFIAPPSLYAGPELREHLTRHRHRYRSQYGQLMRHYPDKMSKPRVEQFLAWDLSSESSDDESHVSGLADGLDLSDAYHQANLDPNELWANPAYVDKPVLSDNTTGVINISAFESRSVPSSYLLIDTGASDHIIFDSRCIVDASQHKPCNVVINTGNGVSPIQSRGPATFIVSATVDGRTTEFELTRIVMYSPNFKVNLFSPGSGRTGWNIKPSYAMSLS